LLTDEVVEKALHSWPDTLYQLNGEEIKEKIKARRDRLPEYAAKFYKILARCPQVFGTHQPDRFVVKSAEGGNISVQVFSKTEGTSSESLHYERLFSPKETKRIYLMGLKGEDVFEVEKRAEKKIKTVIIEEEINPFQLKTGGRS
jgi:hypothetical protein